MSDTGYAMEPLVDDEDEYCPECGELIDDCTCDVWTR